MNKTTCLIACCALFAVVGCGKSKVLEAAENYEKEACACKDAACTTAAAQKYAEAVAKDPSSVSGGDAEAITKATTNATACTTKLAMSAAGDAMKAAGAAVPAAQ